MNPSKTITPIGKVPTMIPVSLQFHESMISFRITHSGTLGYKHGHLFVSDMNHTIPAEVFIHSDQIDFFLRVIEEAKAIPVRIF